MRRTNWRPSKKIAEEVLGEAKREIDLILTHIFHDKDTIGRLDLEATEFSIRHFRAPGGRRSSGKADQCRFGGSPGTADSLRLGSSVRICGLSGQEGHHGPGRSQNQQGLLSLSRLQKGV